MKGERKTQTSTAWVRQAAASLQPFRSSFWRNEAVRADVQDSWRVIQELRIQALCGGRKCTVLSSLKSHAAA